VFTNSVIQQSTGLNNSLNHLLSFLVSENKTLCHPASVDSLSTSAGTEDHVSMGCFAARKVLQVSWCSLWESHFIPPFITPNFNFT